MGKAFTCVRDAAVTFDIQNGRLRCAPCHPAKVYLGTQHLQHCMASHVYTQNVSSNCGGSVAATVGLAQIVD